MQESLRFYYVAHSMKRIEISLSYIRYKNKFKSRNSLFPLIQCFKITFFTFFIQCFKTIICFIWFNISKFFISHTYKKLFAFSFTLLTSNQLYAHAHSPSFHSISNTLKPKMMSFTFNLQWHLHNINIAISLILTHMSRLWPRKRACVFYSMTVIYNFDVEVRYCGFYEGYSSL